MAEVNLLLRPGVAIKPKINRNDVKEILREVYGLKCVSFEQLNGYDDNNFHVRVKKTSENQFIKQINEDGYTLKIVNSLDSQKPQLFEAQSELLLYLGKNGILCPQPVLSKAGQYYIIKKFSSGDHIVRLLEFISGSILHHVPCSKNFFYQIGKYVAELNEVLKNFHHPVYDTHKSVWQLEHVPLLSEFLYVVKDESRKQLIEAVIKEFTQKVIPTSNRLERGMIHGDFNEQNIVIEKRDAQWRVKGILDFGDSHFACYLYELAVTMAYMMIQGTSVDVGGYVLAGYESVRKLPAKEYDLLKVCVAARLCQSLVLGAYSSLQDPDNSYILVTSIPGWALLKELWACPEESLLQYWKSFTHHEENE